MDANEELVAAREALEEEDADPQALEAAARRLEKLVRKGRFEGDDLVEAHFLRGELLLDAGEARRALEAYDAALVVEPGDAVVLASRGEALFALWEFDAAREALERALGDRPDDARVHRVLALCCDRAGEKVRAEKHFREAHGLDPEAYPLPVRISRQEFDELARDAIESLPEEVKERLGPIGFIAEDYPRLAALADRPEDASPETLGVFWGEDLPRIYEPKAQRFVPNHIILFQRNLEQSVETRDELEDEIRTTVYHEVGHFLGYDEDDLDRLGLA